jgi:type II secretory pathway pseudopilin PulG
VDVEPLRHRRQNRSKGPVDLASDNAHSGIKDRELAIKEKELALKERELLRSRWANPIVVAIVAATLAAVANIYLSHKTAVDAERLEQIRWEQTKQDERRKQLGTYSADLAKDLIKTLLLHEEALNHYVNDKQKRFQEKLIDETAYLYWKLPNYRESTDNIERTMILIGTQDGELYERLMPIVMDVRRLHLEVATELTAAIWVHNEFTRRGTSVDIKAFAYVPPWRNRVKNCYRGLAPRLFQALNLRSAATAQAPTTPVLDCKSEQQ